MKKTDRKTFAKLSAKRRWSVFSKKVAGCKSATILKGGFSTGVFCEFYEGFQGGLLIKTCWRLFLEQKTIFLLGLTFTDTDDSQDSRGRRGPSFLPLYHFHPLTNIQKFICNFTCYMTNTYS